MVEYPDPWPWSSFRAMVGEVPAPAWLAVEELLGQFASNRSAARKRTRDFVATGMGEESVCRNLNRQTFLGDDRFVKLPRDSPAGGGRGQRRRIGRWLAIGERRRAIGARTAETLARGQVHL